MTSCRRCFPNDEVAQRLSKQTCMFAEFLDHYASRRGAAATSDGKALLHGHCHQKAVLDFDADQQIARPAGHGGGRARQSGCCGMAGPFGFEKDHYEVSQACAKRVLLPAVVARDAGAS